MLKKFFILFFFFLFTLQSTGYADIPISSINKSDELLIILDFSASMNKRLDDKTRARYVLLSLYNALSSLPKDVRIGLRVFGPDETYQSVMAGNVHTNHDCSATYLKVPINSNNTFKINAKLSEYTHPFGQTPIELSLKQAIEQDFSRTSSIKRVLLITDGTDTCGGNPCKYISQISAYRKNIIIDVVSIADTNGQYGDLSCLPKLTGGTYHIVKTSKEIASSFKESLKVEEYLKYSSQKPVASQISEDIKYKNYLFEINY